MSVDVRLPTTKVELGAFYQRLARTNKGLDRAYDLLKWLVPAGKTVDAALDDGDLPPGILRLACQHFGISLDDIKLLEWYAGHQAEVDAYADKMFAAEAAIFGWAGPPSNN